MVRACVITISDRCSKGEAEDKSGPALCTKLREWNPSVQLSDVQCVPDEAGVIRNKVQQMSKDHDLILTTGGTGLATRDVTIEAVKPLLDKEATGIMTALTAFCLKYTSFAMLSNPLAGFRADCFIVCLPGSKKAVTECFEILAPVLQHVLDLSKDSKPAIEGCHSTLSEVPKREFKEHVCPHKTQPNKQLAASSKQPGVAFRPRKSEWPMMKVEKALALIVQHSKDRCEVVKHTIDFSSAAPSARYHVLAETLLAREEVPNYPASIKDGYAVIASDGPGVYNVVTISQTGDETVAPLTAGSVARVTTGAPVPRGADAVVQVEDTELVAHSAQGEEVSIRVIVTVAPGTDIRPQGSDVSTGEVLLEKGTLVNAAELGLLASQGYTTIPVYSKPRVVVLSTGNELVPHHASKMRYGQVRDSNSQALLHLLAEDGYPVTYGGHVRDELDETVDKLRGVSAACDVLITTGGVSMGETDHLKAAVTQLGGTIHFGRVFMKPGKPTTFASLPDNTLYFGLPGNPVSAMVTYKLFVLPALLAWEGRAWQSTTIPVTLPTRYNLDPRPEYVRAVYRNGTVSVTGSQCSSRLLSMRSANVLLQLPPRTDDRQSLEKGLGVNAIIIGRL